MFCRPPCATAFRSSSAGGERSAASVSGRWSARTKGGWRPCRSRHCPAWSTRLADAAGEYFTSIAALAGAAYKMEMNLAGFYRRISCRPWAAATCRWSPASRLRPLPTQPRGQLARLVVRPTRQRTGRLAADRRITSGWCGSARLPRQRPRQSWPRHLAGCRKFRQLLADTPAPRPDPRGAGSRADAAPGRSCGAPCCESVRRWSSNGALADPDDVFFLTRDEVLAALDGPSEFTAPDIAARRATREQQAKLVPPLLIGRLNPMLKRMWDSYPRSLGAVPSATALVTGSPASGGSRDRAGPRHPRSGSSSTRSSRARSWWRR